MQYLADSSRILFILAVTSASASIAFGKQNENLILNPGAELGKGDMPSAWFAAQVPADGLRMWRTTERPYAGKASLAIFNNSDYDRSVSNNWTQSLKHVPRREVIQLHAYLRTENADAVNICLQCWDLSGETMLAFASTPIFRGDQDWTETSSRMILVPDRTAEVVVRAALTGKGKAWFDDLSVVVMESPDLAVHRRNGRGESSQSARVRRTDDLTELAPNRIVKTVPIVKDCMILAYMPQWNHGVVDNIAVANNEGGVRTLLQWGRIAEDEALRPDRRFFIALYSRATTSQPSAGSVEVYGVKDAWTERTSWENQPSISGDRPLASTTFSRGDGWKLFDVTELVRNGAKDRQFHGVMLRFDKEDKTSQKWSGYAFVSREGIGEWKKRRPRLLVLDAPESQPADGQ